MARSESGAATAAPSTATCAVGSAEHGAPPMDAARYVRVVFVSLHAKRPLAVQLALSAC